LTSPFRRRGTGLLLGGGLAAGAGLAAILGTVNGCAAIAGLDQTYRFTPDGGGDEPDDATLGDAGTRDGSADALVTDAATLPPMSDAGANADADAAPVITWMLDPDFGTQGVLRLPGVLVNGSLPTAEVDETQTLRVAFAAASDLLTVCENPTAADAGCTTLSGSGYPLGLLSNDAGTVLVLTTAADQMTGLSGVGAVAVPPLTYSYQISNGCFPVRALSLDGAGKVRVVASFGTSADLLDLATPNVAEKDLPLAQFPEATLFAAASADGGDIWAAGSVSIGNGAFARILDGGGVGGSGIVTRANRTSYATDVLPLPAGNALVVGGYMGASAGLFALAVPEDADGGSRDLTNTYDLPGLPLSPDKGGRTLIVPTTQSPPFLVVGTMGAQLILLAVNDDGSGGSESFPSLPDAAAPDTLALGAAVLVGDKVYLALALALGSAPTTIPLLARLRHP
jgi:hypothetical protein